MKKKIFLLLLSLLITFCYAITYYKTMWTFTLIAPQYPQGLVLDIHLTGAQGDVFEIDIINHYIGMGKLEKAAVNERAFAPYILLALSFFSFAITFIPNKMIRWLLALPIISFPLVFIAIFFLWLYKFGHDLNPAAPVTLAPFTPTILGTGIIGQFKTYAIPSLGFYLTCTAAILTFCILWIKKKEKNIS
jgi:copper chaperone NosL